MSTGGDAHTKSALKTKGETMKDDTASGDEYTLAQKLGIGIVKESEGK